MSQGRGSSPTVREGLEGDETMEPFLTVGLLPRFEVDRANINHRDTEITKDAQRSSNYDTTFYRGVLNWIPTGAARVVRKVSCKFGMNSATRNAR